MSVPQRDFRAIRRRMRVEAGAWGALVTLNTAFVSLLLISRGAEAFALSIYASGANLFGLGTGLVGPVVAARTGDTARVTIAALTLARLVFVAISLLLAVTSGGALPLLIAALLLWTIGEGVALPLLTTYLGSLSDPTERGRWFAARATAAAVGAACALLPMLLLVRLTSTQRSLQAAYLVAALAALVSTLQVRGLFRLTPAPAPTPLLQHPRQISRSPGVWFLGGVFCFWFGAALNRPVLPPYVVHELHAPAGYFATAAVVAAVSMAAVGNVSENALAESFFATLKREEVSLHEYRTLAEAEANLERFLDDVSNHQRLHSSLGYRPPSEFEAGFDDARDDERFLDGKSRLTLALVR